MKTLGSVEYSADLLEERKSNLFWNFLKTGTFGEHVYYQTFFDCFTIFNSNEIVSRHEAFLLTWIFITEIYVKNWMSLRPAQLWHLTLHVAFFTNRKYRASITVWRCLQKIL